ncbi:TPA: hypothetical protein ACRAQW_003104 [Escherichia coli]
MAKFIIIKVMRGTFPNDEKRMARSQASRALSSMLKLRKGKRNTFR